MLLVSDIDREELAIALTQPASTIVEEVEGSEPWGDWVAAAVPDTGFYLSLTTATAFGLRVSALVSDALVVRGVLTSEMRSVVELCLQEAVANGIIHGNLGIASSAKDHAKGYRFFSHLVSERLDDPALRHRRLDLFSRWSPHDLDISVVDQGAGFDASVVPTEMHTCGRSGRGIAFMRALASAVTNTDGGRCTSLRFKR